MKRIALAIIFCLLYSSAFAVDRYKIPAGYEVWFQSGFEGVQLCDADDECTDAADPDGYYECADTGTVHLRGQDTETLYTWPTKGTTPSGVVSIPGKPEDNFAQYVIENGNGDCVAGGGGLATTLSDCLLNTIETGVTEYDGGTGSVLQHSYIKNCDSAESGYSRWQYNMYDIAPVYSGQLIDEWDDAYFEYKVRITNLAAKFTEGNQYASLGEFYHSNGESIIYWKQTILIDNVDASPDYARMCYKNNPGYDVASDTCPGPVKFESNLWARIRIWLDQGWKDGRFKVTYECLEAGCAVSGEQVLMDLQNTQTTATYVALTSHDNTGDEIECTLTGGDTGTQATVVANMSGASGNLNIVDVTGGTGQFNIGETLTFSGTCSGAGDEATAASAITPASGPWAASVLKFAPQPTSHDATHTGIQIQWDDFVIASKKPRQILPFFDFPLNQGYRSVAPTP